MTAIMRTNSSEFNPTLAPPPYNTTHRSIKVFEEDKSDYFVKPDRSQSLDSTNRKPRPCLGNSILNRRCLAALSRVEGRQRHIEKQQSAQSKDLTQKKVSEVQQEVATKNGWNNVQEHNKLYVHTLHESEKKNRLS